MQHSLDSFHNIYLDFVSEIKNRTLEEYIVPHSTCFRKAIFKIGMLTARSYVSVYNLHIAFIRAFIFTVDVVIEF